ncbi:hypothetical protein [Christiangramia portivictoriae]|uniref:hypothetical protein n=1 Tax=Christiangramia portivictoriae TaxID=326069 RepID=UPI0004266D9F|nr:hypothetical protein [Christiangramia portivictoriae]
MIQVEKVLEMTGMALASRKQAADLIVSEKLISHIIQFISQPQELSGKAWMVLEIIGREHCELIAPFASMIISSGKLHECGSSKRFIMKIFNFLVEDFGSAKATVCMDQSDIEEIIQLSFHFLLNNEKTAVKVFAMQNIYELSDHETWIRPELKALLAKDIETSSAGYRSRASRILRKL